MTGTTEYPLVQAGIDMTGDENELPAVFYENYPGPSVYPSDFKGHVHDGDEMDVHVTYGSGTATFHIVDETAGIDRTYVTYPGGKNDGHASFIMERPTRTQGGESYLPALTDFGTIEFTNVQAAEYGHWYYIGSLSNYSLYMQDDSGTLLATISAILSGKDFYDYWEAAGDIDPVGSGC